MVLTGVLEILSVSSTGNLTTSQLNMQTASPVLTPQRYPISDD